MAVGCLSDYLPFLLKEISAQPRRQYLLLHSLKEVIRCVECLAKCVCVHLIHHNLLLFSEAGDHWKASFMSSLQFKCEFCSNSLIFKLIKMIDFAKKLCKALQQNLHDMLNKISFLKVSFLLSLFVQRLSSLQSLAPRRVCVGLAVSELRVSGGGHQEPGGRMFGKTHFSQSGSTSAST